MQVLADIGQLFFTATAIFALEGISHSMGLHLAEVPPQNLVPAMQVCTYRENEVPSG